MMTRKFLVAVIAIFDIQSLDIKFPRIKNDIEKCKQRIPVL